MKITIDAAVVQQALDFLRQLPPEQCAKAGDIRNALRAALRAKRFAEKVEANNE
jgi:hypothetical protein